MGFFRSGYWKRPTYVVVSADPRLRNETLHSAISHPYAADPHSHTSHSDRVLLFWVPATWFVSVVGGTHEQIQGVDTWRLANGANTEVAATVPLPANFVAGSLKILANAPMYIRPAGAVAAGDLRVAMSILALKGGDDLPAYNSPAPLQSDPIAAEGANPTLIEGTPSTGAIDLAAADRAVRIAFRRDATDPADSFEDLVSLAGVAVQATVDG